MPGQHADILNDYDDAFGVVPPHIAKIPAMRASGSRRILKLEPLDTFDSKLISRKLFYEAFKVNGVTLLRHPEIAAILLPFDEKWLPVNTCLDTSARRLRY